MTYKVFGPAEPRSRAALLTSGRLFHQYNLGQEERDALHVEQVTADIQIKWAAWLGVIFSGATLFVLIYGLSSINRELDSQRADRSYEFVMLTFQKPYNDAMEDVIKTVHSADTKDPKVFQEYVNKNGKRNTIAQLFAFYHNVGTCIALERCDAEIIRTGVTIGSKGLIERSCAIIRETWSRKSNDPRDDRRNYLREYIEFVGADCDG